jgi:hypothetical protein
MGQQYALENENNGQGSVSAPQYRGRVAKRSEARYLLSRGRLRYASTETQNGHARSTRFVPTDRVQPISRTLRKGAKCKNAQQRTDWSVP